MSRVLYLDTFAGIAGDMCVAALIHAGAPLDEVLAQVRALPVWGWTARTERVVRGAYAATRFVVEPTGGADPAPDDPDHGHDHGHGHSHDHGHEEQGDGDPWAGQPARSWRTIRAMLDRANLAPRVRRRATAAFQVLADAEARVHGTPVDEVRFHEVGAVDSIVDIVATCVALEILEIDRIVAAPLPMGHGQVRTAHGLLSVPVPATVEVLRGFPVVSSAFAGELVTPTGAALIAALAEPGHMPSMCVEQIGYGAGTRDPHTHANVLRAVIGRGDAGSVTYVCELRAQVDDLTGESVPGLIDALFEAGALDAWVTPIVMKKGRPAMLLSALTTVDGRPAVGDALLRHGGTFGYRWSTLPREVAERRHEEVTIPGGAVRIKLALRGGVIVHLAPEHEDCAAIARREGRPVAEVRAAALAAWAARGGAE